VEKYIRKGNMTYSQSLQLCQRRRSVVDPIPAFCEQLQKYEKDCRDWGYLTAGITDEKEKKDTPKGAGCAIVGPEAKGKQSTAEKRKVEVSNEAIAPDDAKRSKIVGPVPPSRKGPVAYKPSVKSVIGPSIGPQVGPSNATKPAIGVATFDNLESKESTDEATPQFKKRVIGPAMPLSRANP
jgi:hypothetical protein